MNQCIGQSKLDSLWNVWGDEKEADTVRLDAIKQFTVQGYLFSDPDSAFYFAQLQYDFAKTKREKDYMTSALNLQGISFYLVGDYDEAIEYYFQALELYTEIGNKGGMGAALNNIGTVYLEKGDYDNAIKYLMGSLKVEESIGNQEGVADSYNNIGLIYKELGEYETAIELYEKCLEIQLDIDNQGGLSHVLNNMGVIYLNQGNNEKALDYFEQCLVISEEIEDIDAVALILHNIGLIHSDREDYIMAKEYFDRSLELYIELDDKIGIASSYTRLGKMFHKQKKYDKAIDYGNRGLRIALEIDANTPIMDASEILHQTYYTVNKSKPAYEMLLLYNRTKDSLESEENRNEIIRQEYKYVYEKKAEEDSIANLIEQNLKDAEILVERSEKEANLLVTYYLYAGLLIVLILAAFILNRYRVSNKQKAVIISQKKIVDTAFAELEVKNTEILDSIIYAKRIQSAILPPLKTVKSELPDSFILYKPKDVVAGDFYWLEKKASKVFFSVADCTGHGVPGALVSVVCINALNRTVREQGITDPGKILDNTRDIVVSEFEKSEEDVNDGMDIALCTIEGMKLQYAGANNPLWVVRNGQIISFRADKRPIGKFDFNLPYETHNVDLESGDVIYLFSDGYADQFGGDKGKKFKLKAFMALVERISAKSMEEQHQILETEFENWRGDIDQIDDICIMGIRV